MCERDSSNSSSGGGRTSSSSRRSSNRVKIGPMKYINAKLKVRDIRMRLPASVSAGTLSTQPKSTFPNKIAQ